MCRDISFHSEIQIITKDFQGIKLATVSLSHYPDKMVHVTCEILPTQIRLWLTAMLWYWPI